MAFNCELPDAERLEMILLSIWYRARHSQGYRRKDEKIIGSTVDEVTGLEKSEADLRSAGEALRGPEFVFSAPVDPYRLAEETLLRDEWDGSTPSLANVRGIALVTLQPDLDYVKGMGEVPTKKEVVISRYPTNEKGRAESDLLALEKDRPEWEPKLREIQGRAAWTEEEAEAYAEMTYRWQRLMLSFAAKGWLRLEPPTKFTSVGPEALPGADHKYTSGLDDKGLPYVGTCTPDGLDEAERRIHGHPIYSKGAFSTVESMTGEMKAQVATRNPWAAQKWAQEDGAGA